MIKKILVLLLISLLIATYGLLITHTFAQEEKLTITTYYPSPYGSYRELTAYRMKIGRTFSGSGYTVDDDNLIVEGRVGIGTAIDTGTKVRIHGPATAGSRTLTITDDGATGVVSNLELGLATQSVANRPYIYANTNLAFGANGVERMVLNSIGNVGIGTDNPITRLTVQSQGIDNSRFINTISGGAGVLWVGDAGCPNNNSVGIGRVVPFGSGICGGDLGYDIVIKSDGNVGIGTPIPTSVASPANNQATANLDLNDVYLRSTGRWVSQGGTRTNCGWVNGPSPCSGSGSLQVTCPGNQIVAGVRYYPGDGSCGRLNNRLDVFCCNIQ